MNRFSENYYLRKCYLETDQVPTQSVIMKKMSPSLAKVYFKSMTPKLKILAGLEPPLKGGGNDWYAPPEDLLKGRTVLKPLKKEFLTKLGFNGIDYFGDTILEQHIRSQEEKKNKALHENDLNWKKSIEVICKKQYEKLSKKAAQRNTDKINDAFKEFTVLYTSSINKIEGLLFDAAINEIKRVRGEVFLKMSNHFKTLLKQQATMLYDRYTENLQKKKAELKEQFICNVEKSRTELGNKIHDINVEKHVAIEKLRNLLECQNLACQIYIAMKEKEEREKLLNQSKLEHTKIVKLLTEEITRTDIEIEVAKENEKKRMKFNMIWEEKICQISTTIDNPNAESIFELDKEEIFAPVPEPRPFYLFCDEGFKPQIDREIFSKHCSSSVSQLPVIIINKRCIYAACNNLEEFTDKVEHFIEQDIEDGHNYTFSIPVKFSSSKQLQELKEQSSLMKILQKEMPNIKGVSVECCCVCNLPHCFDCLTQDPTPNLSEQKIDDGCVLEAISSFDCDTQNKKLSKKKKIVHIREPKWESYFEFMEPKTCKCAKIAKKNLHKHLPAYMRKMSTFDYPDLPNYETCSLTTLKKLVNVTKSKCIPLVNSTESEPKTKDICTQYSDQEFENLCSCFDENQAQNILEKIAKNVELFAEADARFNIDGSHTPSYLKQDTESFVNDRALSVSNLLKDSPELEEIFKKEHCSFQNEIEN